MTVSVCYRPLLSSVFLLNLASTNKCLIFIISGYLLLKWRDLGVYFSTPAKSAVLSDIYLVSQQLE